MSRVIDAPTPPASSDSKFFTKSSEPKTYRVYGERLFVLIASSLLAGSNAMQWIGYLPISEALDIFFCPTSYNDTEGMTTTNCKVAYWNNQIFQLDAMIFGVIGLYITDKFGVKMALMCGSMCNGIGALLRLLATVPSFPVIGRLPLIFVGSTIAAVAQPFFIVLPCKVAQVWFADDQRAFANVLSFIANPIGVIIASLLPTTFIDKDKVTPMSNDLLIFNSIMFAIALVVCVFCLLVRRSAPPTPPSASSEHEKDEYMLGRQLLQLMKNRHFLICLIPMIIVFTVNFYMAPIMENILKELGYGQSLAGILTAVNSIVGCCSALWAGSVVDKRKNFKEMIRYSYLGIFATTVAINVFTRFHNTDGWYMTLIMVFLNALLGGFCGPMFPIGVELGVEITYPVAEATSSGVMMLIAIGIYFFANMGMEAIANTKYYYFPKVFKENYSLALDVWVLIAFIGLAVSWFLLNPTYHRHELEQKTKEGQSNQTSMSSVDQQP